MATTDSNTIKQRYNRIAPFFDGFEACFEGLFFKRWRQRLWDNVSGGQILEVGVGTGKNFPFYPPSIEITAIDFSEKMLAYAEQKAVAKNIPVTLALMDVESMSYADNSFDIVLASFVFCSVPQPHKGMKELYRVCKPGGKVILLEHVLSSQKLVAGVMNLLNPLIVTTVGANINRQTVKTVQACGFQRVAAESLAGDVVKLIIATK